LDLWKKGGWKVLCFLLYVEENEKLLDSDMDSNERRELLMVRF
jgi:hypothetical protein